MSAHRQFDDDLKPVVDADREWAVYRCAHGCFHVTVISPDGSQKVAKTDADGQTEGFGQSGRYGAWARYWESKPGERQGQKYEEVRHYATLVFETGGADLIEAVTIAR